MRKEEKTELTRHKILLAATEEFGEKGYFHASMGQICQKGISKGLLYHNFESKDVLYLACVAQCYTQLTEYIDREQTGTDFRRYMELRRTFFQQDILRARLFFETLFQPPQHLKVELEVIRKGFELKNRKMYRELLESIPLRPGVTAQDAENYFAFVQTMFNGYFSAAISRELEFEDLIAAHENSMEKLLDFMLYGIAERGLQKC